MRNSTQELIALMQDMEAMENDVLGAVRSAVTRLTPAQKRALAHCLEGETLLPQIMKMLERAAQ